MTKVLNLLTLNVRGLNDINKCRSIFSWIVDQNIDNAFLQETFCTPKLEKNLKTLWKGEIRNACTDSSHSRGVTILFSESFKAKILNTEFGENGRTLLVNFEYNNETFTVVSVYAPNHENKRIEYLKKLNNWVQQNVINGDNVIIAGDFNVCVHANDRFPQKSCNDKSGLYFNYLLGDCKLLD